MPSFKSGGPGCCCDDCAVRVAPSGLCVPSDATVSVYGVIADVGGIPTHVGAAAAPADNTTLFGTGRPDAVTGVYTLNVKPGIYLVLTSAPGYKSDSQFVYACKNCAGFFPELGAGLTVTMTAGVTPSLSDAPVFNPFGILLYDDVRKWGTELVPGVPSAFWGFLTPGCPRTDTAGTVVDFGFGCSVASGRLAAYYVVRVTSRAGFFFLAPGGSGLCFGMSVLYLQVVGRITKVAADPLAVTGVWDTYYTKWANPTGGSGFGAAGAYTPSTQPAGVPPPPIAGPFTVVAT